jgi:hypothetical protein
MTVEVILPPFHQLPRLMNTPKKIKIITDTNTEAETKVGAKGNMIKIKKRKKNRNIIIKNKQYIRILSYI